MKKLLVIGIIFLFIGVAVAPSINTSVVKASNDNDLVEVTTQACGIQGFGNTTVKLTKQQYQNLQQYLVDFRGRLNKTTTREEAVPIFKEAVVELNKYGLLPKGMSVEQTEKFVIGDNFNQKVIRSPPQFQSDGHGRINLFCLLEAEGIGQEEYNFFLYLFDFITLLKMIFTFPYFNYGLLGFLLYEYSQLKPFRFANWIDVIVTQLSTFGLLGKVNYNENGHVFLIFFTGLKITTDIKNYEGIYLGFAAAVNY